MKKVCVRVPATSANIGPGFDCLGMAMNIFNSFEVEETDHGLHIEGCEKKFSTDENLFYRAMIRAFEKMGYAYNGFNIRFDCAIPICRGLGSSASLIAGGMAAAQLIAEGVCTDEKLLEWGSEMEGHPDNIAPAVFGGFCISGKNGDSFFSSKVEITGFFEIMILIPDFELSTSLARKVIPERLLFGDAVFNISRTALLIDSMKKGDFHNLKIAVDDKIHQPYRSKLIPGYCKIADKLAHMEEYCCFISGAGPSVILFKREGISWDEYLLEEIVPENWSCKKANICGEGFSASFVE